MEYYIPFEWVLHIIQHNNLFNGYITYYKLLNGYRPSDSFCTFLKEKKTWCQFPKVIYHTIGRLLS